MRTRAWLPGLVVLLVLAGCAKRDPVDGVWVEAGNSSTVREEMHFLGDERLRVVIISPGSEPLVRGLLYFRVDNNHLRITGPDGLDKVIEVQIVGDVMTIKDPTDNTTKSYHRSK